MPRVTGIGGIFFKAKDPEKLRNWYLEHLGIGEEGKDWAEFPWFEEPDPAKRGMTVWTIKSESSDYFAPSDRPFMINYRVADIEELASALEAEGIPVKWYDGAEYGRFCWFSDPEGNRIELWEPQRQENET